MNDVKWKQVSFPTAQKSKDTLSRIYSHVVNVPYKWPEIQALSDGTRTVFDNVVRVVVEDLGFTTALLAVVDQQQQILSVRSVAFNNFIYHENWDIFEKLTGVQIIGSSVSLIQDGHNLGVRSCLAREAKFSNDLYDLLLPVVDRETSRRIQTNTEINNYVSVPLLAGDNVVGNLYAGTDKFKITATKIATLQGFVNNAAIAVQNSVLFEQLNQRLVLREAELQQLRNIERMINSTLDINEVLKRILNSALELTGADFGQVVLTGKYATELVHQVSYPEDLNDSFEEAMSMTDLLKSTSPLKFSVVNELVRHDNGNFRYTETKTKHNPVKINSLLGVPVNLGDELIGVIKIGSTTTRTLNVHSLDLLEQIGVQAGIAIRNAYQFKQERVIRERLANVAQVAAMGDMASNMVHRLNNWVGAIRADINYLKRQSVTDKFNYQEFDEILDDMLTNAETTLNMAENIRKPFQHSEQEAIDVNECIRSVLRNNHEKLDKVIIIEDLHEVAPVMATRQLELVFENLLFNALYAMKEQVRGVLKFSTTCSSDGHWVLVTVQDTGHGLQKQLDPVSIFKLGISSKKDGLGYGLWWCDTFLKRWGGNIEFVTNTKRGCKFLITLPTIATRL